MNLGFGAGATPKRPGEEGWIKRGLVHRLYRCLRIYVLILRLCEELAAFGWGLLFLLSVCANQDKIQYNERVTFICRYIHCAKKPLATSFTIMLATSKSVLVPGHNHLLTTGTDDPTLWLSPEHQHVWIIEVKGRQYRWLAGGFDLEIGHFETWLAWWLPSRQCFFWHSDHSKGQIIWSEISDITNITKGVWLHKLCAKPAFSFFGKQLGN